MPKVLKLPCASYPFHHDIHTDPAYCNPPFANAPSPERTTAVTLPPPIAAAPTPACMRPGTADLPSGYQLDAAFPSVPYSVIHHDGLPCTLPSHSST